MTHAPIQNCVTSLKKYFKMALIKVINALIEYYFLKGLLLENERSTNYTMDDKLMYTPIDDQQNFKNYLGY